MADKMTTEKLADESTPLIHRLGSAQTSLPSFSQPRTHRDSDRDSDGERNRVTLGRFLSLAFSSLLIYSIVSILVNILWIWPLIDRHGHHDGHHNGHHDGHYRHHYDYDYRYGTHPPAHGGFETSSTLHPGKPPHHPPGRQHHHYRRLPHHDLEKIMLETPSADMARDWSFYYTSGPHLAGKNLSQAEWTRDKWEQWGVASNIIPYEVYINYPLDHSVSLLKKTPPKSDPDGNVHATDGDGDNAWEVAFRASLTEDVLDQDPTSGRSDRIPTFHGYSATGNVTAPFVFANYGTYQDYADLVDAGIRLEGNIALVRYGGNFRGLKIQRAQELGMVGVLIYSDPGDDGGITEHNGYAPYPEGPARNPSSVQRGSVQFLSTAPGDPTTPGYPSKPGAPRAPADKTTPRIPSIPISYADAIPLLKALNGHGPEAAKLNSHWDRNLGLRHRGVDYNVGPSPDHVVVNLDNQQEYVTTPLWDVIGIVNGTIPDEVLVVGNHRDSWTLGGAGDPNSGSAVLNEVVRAVSAALDAGWRPLRTIVFASWDGEEYGLLGSTEFVEEYLPWVKRANVAYINVDVACSGPNFEASAAPLLHRVLRRATARVSSPNQTVEGQSVADVWDGHISTLGSGSDYTAFQDFAGVPSIDMGFVVGRSAVYHYHSNYDSFYWMSRFGDPGFLYHQAMARIVAVLVAEIADPVVLPFRAADYARELDSYLDQIEARLKMTDQSSGSGSSEKSARGLTDDEYFALRSAETHNPAASDDNNTDDDDNDDNASSATEDAFRAGLHRIRHSLKALHKRARDLDRQAEWANRRLDEGVPWWNIIGRLRLWRTIARVNRRYQYLERHFTFEGGLDGRSWYKHVVFAPGKWTGYAGAVFPGLVESIDAKDYANGLRWAGIIDRCVENAARSLE